MVAAYHPFGDIINFSPVARKGQIGNRFRDTNQAQAAWPAPEGPPGKEVPVKTRLDRTNPAKPPWRTTPVGPRSPSSSSGWSFPESSPKWRFLNSATANPRVHRPQRPRHRSTSVIVVVALTGTNAFWVFPPGHKIFTLTGPAPCPKPKCKVKSF